MRLLSKVLLLAAAFVSSAPLRAADDETKLPAKCEECQIAGGGRYLVLKLKGTRALSVYDATTQKLSTLDVSEDDIVFAAGGDTVFVYLKEANELQTWNIPTQNCVLAHVTTQMQCLRSGTPVGLVFQSIAGSQQGNDAFGISVGLLDEAYALAQQYCFPAGPHFMYFETGQGSALSAAAHHGWDQLTLEARAYGLAKRYHPFQVNTVVGFIGPEYLYDAQQIQRAGLEDHFMGKLTGLPMGVDACYTNHARADQNAIENLAVMLTAAGCNYFMGVPMGDDAMLSYQCTSYHDTATLRQLFGLRPAPEFEAWLTDLGLMQHGVLTEKAGDPTFFLQR